MEKTLHTEDLTEARLGPILKIALPIVISTASYTVMLFLDRLFLSRVGKEQLAAAMSGGLTSMVLSSFFVGLVGYVSALVAQYYGAGKYKMCTRSVIQALYLGLASYPILLAFIPVVKYVFIAAGQEPSLAHFATVYARILLAGSLFLVARTVAGSFFVGIGKTQIVMIANISGTLVNIPANYVLIFGKFGFPAMGIRGAALGTVLSGLFTCLILLGFYVRETSRSPYRTDHVLHFRSDILKRLLRFGLPAGISPFLNWFAFNVFVQIMHSYGPDTAAAATIAFNWDAVVFIPMLGLGSAASTVVGQHIGAKDHDGAQRATYLVIRVAVFYAAVMMILFLCLAELLVSVFSSGLENANGQIANMATTMLRFLTLYSIANACKLVFGGSLRAAGDTTWMMWVSVAIHWAMAIAVIILVRVFHVHQYLAWSTLIMMNNAHFLAVLYRFRGAKWRTMKLIE